MDRLAIVAVVAILIVGAVWLARTWVRKRERALKQQPVASLWDALGTRPDSRPTVISFSTPSCGVCHTAQAPVLDALERNLGTETVRVLRVDAAERSDVARAFGILTVPTTVVLTPVGHVSAIRHGFASLATLTNLLLAPRAA